jgi:hypothetical protein
MKHLCLFFFFTLSIQAQFQVNGIVKESIANEPLAFATITLLTVPLPSQT